MDYFDRFGSDHIRRFVVDDSDAQRQQHALVETRDHHLVRHICALIPELVKIFTSTESRHVSEVVTSSKKAAFVEHSFGSGRGQLLRLLARHQHRRPDGHCLFFTNLGAFEGLGLGALMVAPIAAPVFGFGLVAFGFLGMGPVTIAVDSYGPVTDNAQSVYELSLIEQVPDVEARSRKTSTST